jgi:hypothetical protein
MSIIARQILQVVRTAFAADSDSSSLSSPAVSKWL